MATSSVIPSNNVFKDSVQSIIVKVFSGIKSAASTIAGPQFEEFATQIASRSPVLGQKTKVSPKIEYDLVKPSIQKNFVESPLSDDFKNSLGKDSTFSSSDSKSNDINQHISDILDALDKLVAKEGIAAAKKTEIYKKYESYYETYKKFLQDSSNKNKDNFVVQNKLKTSVQPSIIGSGIPSAEVNNSVYNVSALTNNSTLPDINITGQNVNVTSDSDRNKENIPTSIVEVLNKTIPTFLSKVFSEKLVSKFSENIREKLSKFTTNNNIVKDRINSTSNSDSLFSTNNSTTSSNKIVYVSDKVQSLNTTSDTTNNITSSSADKVSTTKESTVEREIKEDTWREEDSRYKEDVIFELRRINDFLSKRKDSTSDKESDDRDSEDITKKKRSPLLDKVLDKVKDKLSKTSAGKRVKDLLNTVKDKLDIKKKVLPGLETVPDSIPDFDLPDLPDKDTSRKTPRKTTSGKLSKFSKIADFFKDKISSTGSEKLILPQADSTPGLDLPDLPDFNRNEPAIRPKGKLSGGRVPGMLQRGITGIASGASRLGSGVVNLATRAVPMLSSAASAAAPYALPALAVAGAAAAGYGAGTVLNSGISAGLSKVTGQDTTLGGWIYDKFNPEEPAATTAVPQKPIIPSSQPISANTSVIPSKTVAPDSVVKIPSLPDVSTAEKTSNVESVKTVSDITKVVASQTQLVSKISAATDVKDKIETAKVSAPPVVNNITNVSNSSSSSGSGGGSPIIAPSHIRNIESSFERVQMQDFWPRTK